MTRHASACAATLGQAARAAEPPRPRRILACCWERSPATGALACRWEVAGPDLTLIEGTLPERGQPPSRPSLAA